MSDKMYMQALQDELNDCKVFNKALMILAGEVSCVLDEMVRTNEAKGICMLMGEDAGKRLGERARERSGPVENIEEALDTFIYHTESWYGYDIEIDHIEDDAIYINVLKCFIRNILRDRGLTTESPLCGITRGYIKGALKELTGKDVDIKLVVGDVDGICRERVIVKK